MSLFTFFGSFWDSGSEHSKRDKKVIVKILYKNKAETLVNTLI